MRARTWLILSVGLNVFLAATWWYRSKDVATQVLPPPESFSIKHPFESGDAYVRTNIVVRRQNFTWHEVESDDYATYIENLRAIGCPERTIRDIIVADVDQLFSHRKDAEVVVPDFEWWRSDPNPDAVRQAQEKLQAIEAERQALLTRLLGPNWAREEVEVAAPSQGINLEGPLLGELPKEAKQAVHEIASRAQQARDAYLAQRKQAGAAINSADLARLRQTMRNELAKVLTPAQLEEFLLRYSQTAENMRQEFRGMALTPDEFRAIFRARDPFEQEVALLGNSVNPSVTARLREIQARLDETTRRILGNERYQNFKLGQDPLYHQTQQLAQRVGAESGTVLPMYQINQATEAERQRILNDANLSSTEKIDALAAMRAEQHKALQTLLGEDAFRRFMALQEANP